MNYQNETKEETKQRLIMAMNLLDPENNIGNAEWVKIGTALKKYGVPFEAFDYWSSKDTRPNEYKGTQQTLSRWNSFDTSKGSAAVVFGILKAQGKQVPQLKGRSFVTESATTQQESPQEQPKKEPRDNTAYLQACEDALNPEGNKEVLKYIFKRGIDLHTAKKYHLGADTDSCLGDCVVFPYDNGEFIKRPIVNNPYMKYKQDKGITSDLFNSAVLEDPSSLPVFVCEGQFDALSILKNGYKAMALCSVSHVNILLERLKELRKIPPLILCFDNDEAGVTAKNKVVEKTKGMNTIINNFEIPIDYHDVNDWHMKSPEALGKALEEMNKTAKELKERQAQKELEQYKSQMNMLATVADLFADTPENLTPPLSTGFPELDKVLEGGLYGELYTIGAGTGEGKTTFCLQIADNVAKAGHDVLIFSLEMSRRDLVARSVSRGTYLLSQSIRHDYKLAKTEQGIENRVRYSSYTSEELEVIERAKDEYKKYASHIYVVEGIGDINVTQIQEAVERHIRVTGNHPLIIIDYLQIIAPEDVRASDKQAIDKNVLTLKRITRDLRVPMLNISALNREAYKNDSSKLTMASFKESGAIEYTSTVVIGLETMQKLDDWTKEIKLRIFKNRKGRNGKEISYIYAPAFQTFREVGEITQDTSATSTSVKTKKTY